MQIKTNHRSPSSRPRRGARRACAHAGCTKPTNKGKPYCQVHCELNPYAQLVAARIQAQRQ